MNRRTFVTRSIFAAMALSLLLGLPASPARASEEDALRAKWATMPQEKKDLLLQRWKEFQSLSKEEQEKWCQLKDRPERGDICHE